jgi:predicted metal-binding protein
MLKQADLKPFLRRALDLGAEAARVIDPATIITAAWVRMKCRYGCGAYGSTLCCPPHTPTPDETRQVIDCYGRAILVHVKPERRGSVPDVKHLVVALEREIFLAGYYKAFALGAGPCMLCAECNLTSCVHAYDARPALEACGVDVFATARGNGFPLEVVTDASCDQNHYGAVLVD